VRNERNRKPYALGQRVPSENAHTRANKPAYRTLPSPTMSALPKVQNPPRTIQQMPIHYIEAARLCAPPQGAQLLVDMFMPTAKQQRPPPRPPYQMRKRTQAKVILVRTCPLSRSCPLPTST
jgi:hypothetical protein